MFKWVKKGSVWYYQNEHGTIQGWIYKEDNDVGEYKAQRENIEHKWFDTLDKAKLYVDRKKTT